MALRVLPAQEVGNWVGGGEALLKGATHPRNSFWNPEAKKPISGV